MTKKEAAIVSAFTGILIGDFSELHTYVEEIMKRPVFTHEMGDKKIADKIKELSRPDFLDITIP